MKESGNGSYRYQVGGALGQDVLSYVTREADTEFYQALQKQEFCYVLNCRQMGKSSLMVRTLARLQADGWAGIVLDFSAKDSQGEKPDRWYNGIINQLNRHFRLLDNARSWLKERDFLSPVERLEEFIQEVLLTGINQPIVIFIDEIDSTINLNFTDDFFALIRACYNKRAENPDYQRLTFALLGVASPSDLISDKKRTPFNIGKAIDLKGFQLKEVGPLIEGLARKAEHPQTVLQEVLKWTGGQPFLSQRLCQILVDVPDFIRAGSEAKLVEKLVWSRIIENWESTDEQEHLKNIRNRLFSNEQNAGYLLELYRKIWQNGQLKFRNYPEERDLQLSGLVVKRDDYLTVYNTIYQQVFNEPWIDRELGKLRPYCENFRAWLGSGKTDLSRLLRGEALEQAEQWSQSKNLSGEDLDFLSASRTQVREEEIAAKEREAELEREKTAREGAEEAEKIQAKANQKAQRRIRNGSIVLGLTLLAAIACGAWGVQAGKKAQEQNKIAIEAEERAIKAENKEEQANKEVTNSKQELTELKSQLQSTQKDLNSKQKSANKANKKLQEVEQAKTQLEKDLARTTERYKETLQAFKAVRGLSVLAGTLRKEGVEKASNEALRKAGLSTLIDDEELKQAWLWAATAEGHLSLAKNNNTRSPEQQEIRATELEKAKDAIEQSINSLKEISKQEGVFQQVKAFTYFMKGKLNKDDPQAYLMSYNALKASQFNPLSADEKKDILIDKDVEDIHYSTIKSNNNININDPDNSVAKSFRQYLYDGLDSLLKQDRLQDADLKTYQIMVYLAQRGEQGWLSDQSLENFPCDELKKIDGYWYNYPKKPKHFGFGVQKEIWEEKGSPTWRANMTETEAGEYTKKWRAIYIDLGWKTKDSGEDSPSGYVAYDKIKAFTVPKDELDDSPSPEIPRGNIPWLWWNGGWMFMDREGEGEKRIWKDCNL
ncbi:MAG TPA: hypothetical protein DCF68_21330 [Cyanothece sp. UBA12306]|nr:hypothetical protein [Cyanothece sp. UBA12306]